jgi:hypothetical protein
MVSKATFEALAMSDDDGNYFLRSDRIMGAFSIVAGNILPGYEEAFEALSREAAMDQQTKELLATTHRNEELFRLNLRRELNAMKAGRAARGRVASTIVESSDIGDNLGDTELTVFSKQNLFERFSLSRLRSSSAAVGVGQPFPKANDSSLAGANPMIKAPTIAV